MKLHDTETIEDACPTLSKLLVSHATKTPHNILVITTEASTFNTKFVESSLEQENKDNPCAIQR